MNYRLSIVLLMILILWQTTAEAQTMNRGSNMGNSRSGGSQKRGKPEKTKMDSIVFKMKEYKLVDDLSRDSEVKVDTSITNFHIYDPAYRNSISVQSLGNIGNAYQYTDFFKRKSSERDFLFQSNYSAYESLPGDIPFYNVTKPYTLLSYGQWFSNKPKGETLLKVFHTQNINKQVNFGFFYNSIGASGKYLNQQAKDHSTVFFSSGNFERYDYWFTIGKNSLENQENGGLPNPKDIENPDVKPEEIAVWLTDVKSVNNNSFVALSHQYKLGIWKEVKEKKEIYQKFIPRVAFMHVFDFQKSTRSYTEADPNQFYIDTNGQGTFYFYGKDHVPNINATTGTSAAPATIDNAGQSVVTNRFYLKFLEAPDRKYSFGKQLFISNDLVNLYYPRQEPVTDSLGVQHAPLGLTQSANYANTYIGASAYRTDGRFWNWNASVKSWILGRNALDYELAGSIYKPLRTAKDTSTIAVFARMTNKTPNFYYDHYYSNHYKWENAFDRVYVIRVGASFEKPLWQLKMSANYSIINHYLFFNEKALPEQAQSEFSVAQLMINKDFTAGVLHVRNWGILQKTTTDKYLALPLVSLRNSTYLEGVYAKVLSFQFGLDTRYETAYYADNYAPATGMFFRQSTVKVGDYAWIDAFVNLKIKRTAFYFKYTNLTTQFVKGGFYTSPSYPAPVTTLLFGLSWSFYN
ncbi:MAG: putative porin [Marinilabiliales bacterium]|nr:putative porin [Marinilabiliales bacterium]